MCGFYTYPSSARAKDGVRMRQTTWRNAFETITAYATEFFFLLTKLPRKTSKKKTLSFKATSHYI